jgi:exopolyphosphatase / guanosine-5'-triphosphate,3'-diphosphate pyrophosphatase
MDNAAKGRHSKRRRRHAARAPELEQGKGLANGLPHRDLEGPQHRDWRRRPRGPVFAALDLGTNNCRLLVARPVSFDDTGSAGFKVIDAFSRIVRLGEGLGDAMPGEVPVLSEAAVERTLEALKVCAQKMRRRGVSYARNVATEACRRAANGANFLARVESETGLAFEVISPDEEARLAMTGCLSLLDPELPHALLFDIGGGSTELSWLKISAGGEAGTEAHMLGSISLPMGVVAFAERYGGRHVDRAAYRAMVEEVSAALEGFDSAHEISAAVGRGGVQMIGTSGTVTTIAGVYLELPRYDRALVDGTYLGFDVMAAATRRLRDMSFEERAAHPCVGHERADLVIAGLAILDAICRLWPVGRLRVADRGLREGILIGLMKCHRELPRRDDWARGQ